MIEKQKKRRTIPYVHLLVKPEKFLILFFKAIVNINAHNLSFALAIYIPILHTGRVVNREKVIQTLGGDDAIHRAFEKYYIFICCTSVFALFLCFLLINNKRDTLRNVQVVYFPHLIQCNCNALVSFGP